MDSLPWREKYLRIGDFRYKNRESVGKIWREKMKKKMRDERERRQRQLSFPIFNIENSYP